MARRQVATTTLLALTSALVASASAAHADPLGPGPQRTDLSPGPGPQRTDLSPGPGPQRTNLEPVVANEPLVAPPPTLHEYLQYGVALAAETVASAGPICSNVSNCILGSGGGIAARAGWRPSAQLYLGGAYEASKQDPNQLYRLGILQQARFEMRRYFPTGKEIAPFALVGAGVHGYGNEWSIDTWGPDGTLGVGMEVELGGPVLELTLAYRPMYFRSWVDTSTLSHPGGIAHFVSLEVALEAKDAL